MSSDVEPALAALRTWRTVTEDRDRLVGAAKAAGATWDQIISASGLARGTVASILAAKPAQETGTSAGAPVEHHPHFGGHDPSGSPAEPYMFRPFSGLEDPPLPPNQRAGETDAAYAQRVDRDEWRAAWTRWRRAHLRLQAREPLTAMAARWADCVKTHADMTAAFDHLVAGPDGNWRAGISRLLDTRAKALAAATSWDEAAADLLLLQTNDPQLRELNDRAENLYGQAGSCAAPYTDWDTDAHHLGIDTAGWVIGKPANLDDARPSHAYRDHVEGEIAVQDQRIGEINRLTKQ